MTKRIAIQFFGHLRTFEQTVESFVKNVLEPNKKFGYIVDVFMHTWDETEHNDCTPWNNPTGKKRGSLVDDKILKLVKEKYSPKKFLAENQIELSNFEKKITQRNNIPDKRTKNIAHTFCSVNKLRCEYEKENKIKYDLIIATRPDIIFYKPLSLEYIFRDFSNKEIKNTVFYMDIPNLDCTYCTINQKEFICGIDLLIIGGQNAYSAIEKHLLKRKEYLIQNVPEKTISQAFYKEKIYTNLFQYPKPDCWSIKRDNTEGQK